MVLKVSFYKPVDAFGSAFNRLAAWWTAGEFCHCELVVSTSPAEVMEAVKNIYQGAQKGEYPPEDCLRIISQIEMYFFDTEFRKLAQSTNELTLSFSQILGRRAEVRVLKEVAHDTWFKLPDEKDSFATLMPVNYDVSPEDHQKT